MKKTIEIQGQTIELETNGLVPILYKREFKSNFFADLQDVQNGEMEILYRLAWLFARTANKTLPSFDEWLSGFEVFPIADVAETITTMATACIVTTNPNATKSKNEKMAKH